MSLKRFVVVEESQRLKGCLPGPVTAPKQRLIDLAADVGAALDMAAAVETVPLEQCALDEFHPVERDVGVLRAGSGQGLARGTARPARASAWAARRRAGR